MAEVFCENCSFLDIQGGHIALRSEANGALLLIMLGKVSLNLFLLHVRKQNHRPSFMSYFCTSLAVFDLMLLVLMSFIFCFQNIVLWGVRFTEYHICLLPQITAFLYGVLHYPVSLIAGLDYYFTITSQCLSVRWRSAYAVAMLIMWIFALGYILSLPSSSLLLINSHGGATYQCPFYISSQTYWLSLGMLATILLVLVLCWSEVMEMVQSTRLITFDRETVLFFPYELECSSRNDAKHLLTRLLISFTGTWAPFVLLQTFIVLFSPEIPAYIEMNVPWLYFVNSFLIGIACWMRRQDILFAEETWDVDPFVSWKFCFIPVNFQKADKSVKLDMDIINF